MGTSKSESKGKRGNIVDLIDPAYRSALDKAIKEQSFELFLDAIDLIAESSVQEDSAVRVWTDLEPKESPDEIPGIFLRWLAGLSFETSSKPTGDVGSTSDYEKPDEATLSAIRRLAAEEARQAAAFWTTVREFMNADESKAFHGFYGVVPFRHFINEPFAAPLSDAASVIAEHIRHLLDPGELDAKSHLIVRQRWLREFILEQLIPWVIEEGETAEEHDTRVDFFDTESSRAWQFIPDLLSGVIDLEDPKSFPEGFDAAMLPRLLLMVPQELFDRLSELAPCEFPEFEYYGQEEPYLDLFDVLTILPMKGERLTVAAFKNGIWKNSILHPLLDRFRIERDIPRVEPSVVANTVFNYSVSLPSIKDFSQDGMSTMGGAEWTATRLEARVVHLNRRILGLRRTNLGKLPLDLDDAIFLAVGLHELSFEEVDEIGLDLALLLAGSEDASMTVGYESGIASPELAVRREGDTPEELLIRSQLFGQAIRMARAEGLIDLSDALLGFYLVTQVLCDSERNSIDWSVAGDALREASPHFSKGLLADCVELAYQLAGEHSGNKGFDRSRLNSFRQWASSESISVDAASLLRMVHADVLLNAKRSLSQALSTQTREALPSWIEDALLEAENDYLHRISRSEAENSSIDFAPVVLGFFAPIEKLLRSTLDFVSDHPSFKDAAGVNLSSKHIPIAKVIGLFQGFRNFPEDLKVQLREERCRLGSAREYSLDWLNDIRRIRNRAAHGELVSKTEVETVRRLLFSQGLECLLRGVPSQVLKSY